MEKFNYFCNYFFIPVPSYTGLREGCCLHLCTSIST